MYYPLPDKIYVSAVLLAVVRQFGTVPVDYALHASTHGRVFYYSLNGYVRT